MEIGAICPIKSIGLHDNPSGIGRFSMHKQAENALFHGLFGLFRWVSPMPEAGRPGGTAIRCWRSQRIGSAVKEHHRETLTEWHKCDEPARTITCDPLEIAGNPEEEVRASGRIVGEHERHRGGVDEQDHRQVEEQHRRNQGEVRRVENVIAEVIGDAKVALGEALSKIRRRLPVRQQLADSQ